MPSPRYIAAILLAIALAQTAGVCAQDYPTKPIRVLTTAPGGGGDIASRIIAPALAASLGQPVVIDNRTSTIISAELVARAPPDGYTLTVYGSTLWLAPLMQHTAYDPVKELAPVTVVTSSPNVMVIHPSLQVKTVRELIALAKAQPGKLNYAAGNPGSSSHLAMELFKTVAGVDIVRIPFKGVAPALTALAGGEIQVMLSTAASAAPHIKAGRLKALAVSTAKPSALFPDLPTIASSLPGYETTTYTGMFTTAKTPAAVIALLNRETIKVISRSEVKDRYLASGVEAIGSSPEEFGQIVKSEMARMGKVIRDAGIRLD